MASKQVDKIFSDIIADLASDSKPQNIQYLRDGDTTMKLTMPPGRTDIRQFYQKFNATYKGDIVPYYLISGIITDADEDGVANPNRVRYVKVTKTILIEIVNLLTKKWDLFGDPGDLIVILKGKKSGKTSYSVTALKENFSHPVDLQWPDVEIETAAQQEEEKSAEQDAGNIPF